MKWAHSAGHDGSKEPLKDHLESVAVLAGCYAEAFGARDEAFCIGLWHDLGKLGAQFQEVLEGKASGVDHWTLGGYLALERYRAAGRAALLCILGHHLGIPRGNEDSIRELCPRAVYSKHPKNLTLSPSTFEQLEQLMREEGIDGCARSWQPLVANEKFREEPARAMLGTRMLFSCLVDADFICTERHFSGPNARKPGKTLNPKELWAAFERLLGEARALQCSAAVREVREEVLRCALEAAKWNDPILTLTAPTGSGKTLAMLGFAIQRAMQRRHCRIILALPYLSLLQEITEIYRSLARYAHPDEDPDSYLLEAHSLREDFVEEGESDCVEAARRKLVENWDAPIILTTNVQLLESLHSNRTARCRKLHNIANSVILMDEVQTVPRDLALPTLATLSALAEDFHCSILMATATQPAFHSLDEEVRRNLSKTGWKAREIIPQPERLFQKLRRVSIRWAFERAQWSESDVVAELLQHDNVLCILNLKRHARRVFAELRKHDPEALLLSTSLCPAHRRTVLEKVKAGLRKGTIRLVSTQCVEAGVDLDFRCVFRSIGPLEAIAQAAGRCNRNGMRSHGEVIIFELTDDQRCQYPDVSYQQAAQVAEIFVKEAGGELDLGSPDQFHRYYERLYGLTNHRRIEHPVVSACRKLDFPELAEKYRLVREDHQISMLVPYCKNDYDDLRQEALEGGLTREWIRRARPYAVSLYRPPQGAPLWSALDTIPLWPRGESTEWLILRDPALYDGVIGLVLPNALTYLEY